MLVHRCYTSDSNSAHLTGVKPNYRGSIKFSFCIKFTAFLNPLDIEQLNLCPQQSFMLKLHINIWCEIKSYFLVTCCIYFYKYLLYIFSFEISRCVFIIEANFFCQGKASVRYICHVQVGILYKIKAILNIAPIEIYS